MKDDRVAALLEPVLAHHGLELEELDVVSAGKRRVVRIVVDGDGPHGRGPLLDEIAEASRMCSAALDASDTMGAGAYTLEVSSRGISRPLTRPAHWRRNRDRLVLATLEGGEQVLGRVLDADERAVTLQLSDGPEAGLRELALADVTKAQVQIEMNRKRPGAGAADDLDDLDDEGDEGDEGDDQGLVELDEEPDDEDGSGETADDDNERQD